MNKYNCVVVLGPTAVGKTSIGVAIAHAFNGEIISADSRQTYRLLDIGSGKDLDEYIVDGKKIPYHMIDICDLSEEYNVFNYQKAVYPIFDDILNRNKLPVIVGGTGLYLDSIVRAYDLLDVPENKELREKLNKKTLEELKDILLELLPNYHQKSDFLEKDRLIKAIEIESAKREMGEELREKMYPRPDIKPLIIGSTLERPELWKNISIRLRERLDNGMLEEVQKIYDSGYSWERLEKLGLEYRFTSLYLQGKIKDKEDLYEQLFIAIRQFAKRQETWFRFMEKNGVKINWLKKNSKAQRIEEAINLVKENF